MLRKELKDEGRYGESWEVSGHEVHVSCTEQGERLTEVWGRLREGASELPESFPWLIKFLDCHELLSVQVHPNDALAAQLLGDERGKTEAWIILEVEETGRIYAGLKPGVDRQALEQHLQTGTVADCLHSFQPRPGDCLYLPAGTVHAVGGGVLMAEVQQSSDATFRLFDWNRLGSDGQPRPLHVREALTSIDWTAGPVSPVVPQPLASLPETVNGSQLVSCPYFVLRRYQLHDVWRMSPAGGFSVWMVLAGSVSLHITETNYLRTFQVGDTVLVPEFGQEVEWSAAGNAELLEVLWPG